MHVELVNRKAFTKSLHTATRAALICTGNENTARAVELYRNDDLRKDFLLGLIKKEHLSILEHINLTFEVRDISRALLQELARHRHISLSVKSTRYTMGKLTDEEIDSIAQEMKGHIQYSDNVIAAVSEELCCLTERIAENLKAVMYLKREDNLPSDFVKYFLPEFLSTNLMLTLNARELRHILNIRSAPSALLEFRKLTRALYKAIPEKHQWLFSDCMHYDG